MDGINKVIAYNHVYIDNPYYKKGTCEAILNIIKSYPLNNLVQKHFYDL